MSPLAGVLNEAWTAYRRHAAHFLTIAFFIYLVTAVLVALLTRYAGVVGLIVAAIIDLVAAFLVQASLVKAVQDVRDGHRPGADHRAGADPADVLVADRAVHRDRRCRAHAGVRGELAEGARVRV